MPLRGRKPIKEPEDDGKSIDINAQMQGSLTFTDPVNLRIHGDFSGSLTTKGTLTIGELAKVDADISGENIVIAGKVNGNINADKMLVLMPTAILKGNIATPKLNIVEGALFEGHCQMREVTSKAGSKLLNLNEVAKFLEIDLSEIESLANSGQIPGIKSGNEWQFEREKIENWASSGKVV